MVLILTKADIEHAGTGTFEVLNHQQVVGHTATSGPHIKVSSSPTPIAATKTILNIVKYTNLRVPAKNLLCPPGKGAAIISASFDISGMFQDVGL